MHVIVLKGQVSAAGDHQQQTDSSKTHRTQVFHAGTRNVHVPPPTLVSSRLHCSPVVVRRPSYNASSTFTFYLILGTISLLSADWFSAVSLHCFEPQFIRSDFSGTYFILSQPITPLSFHTPRRTIHWQNSSDRRMKLSQTTQPADVRALDCSSSALPAVCCEQWCTRVQQ